MSATRPGSFNAPNATNDILKQLNLGFRRGGRRRPGGGRRPRPNRRTTPMPDDHNHHENENDNATTTTTTTASSVVDRGPDTKGSMDNDDDDDDDHDHATDHDDFTCQPTSSQHSAYIRANLEMLQKKCEEFHECTDEVYKAENFHRILSGGNIQLSNICGLMYANGGGRYTTLNEQCSRGERGAIRQDIGNSLVRTLADPPTDDTKPVWLKLGQCLMEQAEGNEHRIDTTCRLKKNTTFLCGNLEVDHVTEDFFNHEMEHLHCSCKAISAEIENAKHQQAYSSALSLPARIGIAGGVIGLLVILFIMVVVLCIRHRRVKRELDKHRIQYLPSPHSEPSAIYQEIGDQSQALEALRRARDQGKLPLHYQYMDQAPAVPDRYVKPLTGSRPNLTEISGDPEYLEPLPDPPPGQRFEAHTNDAYNASQTSQRSGENVYDLAKHPGNTPPTARANQADNDTYFDRINLNRKNNGEVEGGYLSLSQKYGRKQDRSDKDNASPEEIEPLTNTEGQEGGKTSPEEPKYFVLESQKETPVYDAVNSNSVPV